MCDTSITPLNKLLNTFDKIAVNQQKDCVYIELLRAYPLTYNCFSPYFCWDTDICRKTLIYQNDDIDLFLVCWLPGQRSEIHDHDSFCAMRVIAGRAVEKQYDINFGRLQQRRTRILHTGEIVVLEKGDIHKVINAFGTPLVTLHVYEKQMNMTIFKEHFELDEGEPFDPDAIDL
ncbi:MAG: cysteine dioxygenase family protein [Gammaproteobacteria bacterium]|nr:cysteine dioxygenase family protein [Gammaproteobacteria bacterium]